MELFSLTITNPTEVILNETLISKTARCVLEAEMCKNFIELSIHICGDDEMCNFNRLYRGQDSLTDILSFISDPFIADSNENSIPVRLCDIIIDINQLDRQKGQHTLEKELVDVTIHGLLHCCGYDHIRSGDSATMKQKESHYKKLMDGDINRG